MSMKVNQDHKVQEPFSKRAINMAQPKTTFQSQMDGQREKMQMDALQALLTKVDEQAKRLVHSRTVRDVQVYKKAIQTFVQEAIQFGLGTKSSHSWSQSNSSQLIVKKIDEKLVTLTDHVLKKETDSLNLLDQLGEIRGLLVNLYV
ncbi:YaaR family protein [Terrilactibacillus laevilacticus]|uniref:YaaR family protein n=1 Tax=Terrilactibacillus laevilacticus TaxID=1380157 RepID=UPI0011469145|nr:YaaR family protein [Terrilactibacillus laevilacticus]